MIESESGRKSKINIDKYSYFDTRNDLLCLFVFGYYCFVVVVVAISSADSCSNRIAPNKWPHIGLLVDFPSKILENCVSLGKVWSLNFNPFLCTVYTYSQYWNIPGTNRFILHWSPEVLAVFSHNFHSKTCENFERKRIVWLVKLMAISEVFREAKVSIFGLPEKMKKKPDWSCKNIILMEKWCQIYE